MKNQQIERRNSWIVDEENYFRRIDKFLRHVLHHVPLSALYKLLRTGKVKLNGRTVREVSERLEIGDLVEVVDEDLSRFNRSVPQLRPATLDLKVILEDESLLAISKPAGVSVHPGHRVTKPSLIEGVLAYARERGFEPFLVHRLDKDTSGVLIVAKSRLVARELSELFSSKSVGKTYVALVFGIVRRPTVIDRPLDGLHSRSFVEPIETFGLTLAGREVPLTLVRVKIETGRKHQIRRHLASIGCPVVCDGDYGNFKLNREFTREYGLGRQFLHCASIRFEFRGVDYLINDDLASDLQAVLRALRIRSIGKGAGKR